MNAFLRVNAAFYCAVKMIHDVIRTVNPFPCPAKFMFVELEMINRIRI